MRRLGLKVLVATAAASAVLWLPLLFPHLVAPGCRWLRWPPWEEPCQRRVEPRVAASAVASMVAPSQFAMAKAKADGPPQPSPPPPEAGSLRRPIPHRLHQSWKSAAIPKVWAPFIRSWVDLHPGWSYTFYSDDALRRFFVAELPEFLAVRIRRPLSHPA